MMMNLKMSGIFDKISGLVVGGMSDMNDNTVPFGRSAEEIIGDHIMGFEFPVAFNFPAGHIRTNLPLILGSEIKLEVKNDGYRIEF
jgi:muramoyltetrapeptide carboxypeptidase